MPMEINPFDYFAEPQRRLYWLFLLSSLIVAGLYLYVVPTARKRNFSAKLWLHPSALLDYHFFLLSVPLKVVLVAPLVIGVDKVALFVNAMLVEWFGFYHAAGWSYQHVMWLLTAVLFVVSDFSRYWLHRMLHTVPMLWRFHQVHHSARVLTPLTFYRVHPVESFLFGLRYSLAAGSVLGVFVYFFGALVNIYDVLGVNIIGFIFSLMGSNLRHSHIHLRYPPWLEWLFISPAQHHIHHSKRANQANFGGSLALWDTLFGSLKLSNSQRLYVIGLERQTMRAFTSVAKLLFKPFQMNR